MKRISVVWVCVLLWSSSVFVLINDIDVTEGRMAIQDGVEYVIHDPIRINGNGDFAAIATSGDGNPGNPWIIEGWDINGSGIGTGIFIGNTTDYFEIRNCYLHDANASYGWPYFRNAGIQLYYASNGIVDSNILQSNNYAGLSIFYSHNTNVTNNTINNSNYGIYSEASNINTYINNNIYQNNKGLSISWTGASIGSHFNNIIDNNISFNLVGIKIYNSINNTVYNNSICWNGGGIDIHNGEYNIINDNNISNNGNEWSGYGISIYTTEHNYFLNNILFENWGASIIMGVSQNNTFSDNIMVKGGFEFRGNSVDDYNTHSIDLSNKVDDKPIYYLKNQSDGSVPLNAGQILLANCTNFTIKNFNFQNLYSGIMLGFSDNISISNVTSINNVEGIYTQNSNNNTINNSTFSNNEMHGVWLTRSNRNVVDSNIISSNNFGLRLNAAFNNKIHNNNISFNTEFAINLTGTLNYSNYYYYNNFINNGNQGYQCSDRSWDIWNLSHPGGGNYWSDYTGVDLMSGPGQDQPGSDGFGDTNYSIDWGTNADHYPLMKPIEFEFMNHNYSLSEGWNLVSLPAIQSDESLDSVLDSIDGKWDCIQAFDSINDIWQSNITTRPDSQNDLDSLDHKMGFWINITEPNVNLTVRGHVPISTTIPLHAGWNLVGYPTLNDAEIVANALWGTGADKVEVFDPAEPYRIKEVGPTYVMKPGEGYWVHVPADTIWVVDW